MPEKYYSKIIFKRPACPIMYIYTYIYYVSIRWYIHKIVFYKGAFLKIENICAKINKKSE